VQSPGIATLLLIALAACSSAPEQDTIWPPKDFEVTVEEVREAGDGCAVRRFRVRADGVACFGTASTVLADPVSKTVLPVFDRLCVYQLVPTCTRALARRVHRAGVSEIESVQGERNTRDATSVTLRWQAFDARRVLKASGRVHGAMAEILAVLGAHLPEHEQFELPGIAERAVAPVLRGVPAPVADANGALEALLVLLRDTPSDRVLLLDAFALACHVGKGAVAEDLLARWMMLTAEERRAQQVFPEGDGRLTPEILTRLLPAG
jgi:hypothetical protein